MINDYSYSFTYPFHNPLSLFLFNLLVIYFIQELHCKIYGCRLFCKDIDKYFIWCIKKERKLFHSEVIAHFGDFLCPFQHSGCPIREILLGIREILCPIRITL